jgi:hypothetical protein
MRPSILKPPLRRSKRRRVWIRDRVGDTGRAVAETGSVAPGVSGNGCVVAYTVVDAGDATLTAVDRCATPIESPLPIGTVLDTVALDTPEPDADVIVAAEPQADESQADESQADDPDRRDPDRRAGT